MRKRSLYCGELRATDEGRNVVLQGWVHRVRNFGGCIFVDLRDREGKAQLVFRPGVTPPQVMERAAMLRPEFVVEAAGKVVSRGANVNPKMPTGEVEVAAEELEVLAEAEPPPFPIEEEISALETTRLQYRYLDLRRPPLQRNILFRSRALKIVRDYLSERGFIEIETPFLTKSTPEGARDYLVPSRVEPGRFYALPQSPQLFKQLLMIAGFDRYFQIVRCFRDEDLRADRQPEFTQLDLEMSFIRAEDVMEVIDGLLSRMVGELLGREIETPAVITYEEAVRRFGVDNPDIRFGMELVDLSEAIRGGGMDAIDRALGGEGAAEGEGGRVAVGIKVEGSTFSRRDLDDFALVVKGYGAGGLFWLRKGPGVDWSGSAKKLSSAALDAVQKVAGVREGDLVLFVVGGVAASRRAMGKLRVHIAQRMGLLLTGSLKAVWVKDFPMFEWNVQEERWNAMHHPFTSPHLDSLDLLETDPGKVKAQSYDIVLNGQEIGGGSIRIHRPELQKRVFGVLGIGEEEARGKFGFLLQALSYGAPPHGGIALGMDRLIAVLLGLDSIRETIAFPKTTSASCLLTGSPSPVSQRQLEELGLEIRSSGEDRDASH